MPSQKSLCNCVNYWFPKFGDIYLIHKKSLRFGSHEKLWHYAIQSENSPYILNQFRFVPVTSKKIRKSKSCFEFNFDNDTNIKLNKPKKSSYAFFYFLTKIKLNDVYDPSLVKYKGNLLPHIINEYKDCVVEYYKLNNIR